MFGKTASTSGASSKKSKGVDEEAIDALYTSFADEEDPDQWELEHICNFAVKLGMDPEKDVRLLVLLWKMNAVTKPGTIMRKEFVAGMTKELRKDNMEDLATMLPSLDPGFLERSEFRDFYKFVFQFSREGTQKTIDKESIAQLMNLVLDKNRAPHLEYFLEFLKLCNHQRITLDQWDSFLQFQLTVSIDITNYDEDGAWPLLLDEYVEWRKKNASK